MAKVTSKLQVTVPKALAERYGIDPGDEIEWEAAGDVIRVVPPRRRPARDVAARVRLFDQATARQKARERASSLPRAPGRGRGWTRDELYGRGRAR
jgi:AbrB family looped-hinge helix DNA binding protein